MLVITRGNNYICDGNTVAGDEIDAKTQLATLKSTLTDLACDWLDKANRGGGITYQVYASTAIELLTVLKGE